MYSESVELGERGLVPGIKRSRREIDGFAFVFVRPEGFEPPVSAFGGPRVIQLRYGREVGPTSAPPARAGRSLAGA